MHEGACSCRASADDLCGMKNQKIIVAGGTSGIGLATAKLLASEHAIVTVTGRNPQRLSEASSFGLQAVSLDSGDRGAVERFFATQGAAEHLVISLSGNTKGVGEFASLSLDELKVCFEEKFWPILHTIQVGLPYLNAGGSVTVVTAVSAIARMPGTSGLGALNGALEVMVRVWAKEWKSLRVNAVSPGVIDTPWWNFVPLESRQETLRQYTQGNPVGRAGTPEEVADAIAFLVGNAYMTGQVIYCDGGLA
jgi:NAD(P)-dependent dehydrogenase (short-subunit alcohol dehydrogenase family)